MAPSRQKLSALPYLLSLFEDLKLELEPELKLESELESELPLLLVSGMTGADTYQTSVDHKGDTWIAMDLGKHGTEQLLLCCSHDADHTCQLHDCFGQIEGPEAY